ncbi:uncharacterized protein G2W53_020733 [Senna tora]|uniref:Uncharacterized protein n=1 Tax=Senna tora TaxID=362788 RepID=A0A834WMT1_9FABA|nr:uncharacterized protein G2W53_020733 [Senna tora]
MVVTPRIGPLSSNDQQEKNMVGGSSHDGSSTLNSIFGQTM